MTVLLLVAALAGLAAIGVGAGYLRAARRPALVGSFGARLQQWFATLQGPRAVGAGLVAAGALTVLLALALRP